MSEQTITKADLHLRRLERWRQTPQTRLSSPEEALQLIEKVGMATLFTASEEVPNLYHAYMGDPNAKAQVEWDSPAGEVYGWRWAIGRKEAAFYTALVRKKPTWISWTLLPAILRLKGELREPEELYWAGELSANARKIYQVLEAAPQGVLGTGDLRQQAGFPSGKEQRAAYLKAVEELEIRLLLAKVFSPNAGEGEEGMQHALVRVRYAGLLAQAQQLTTEDALDQFLKTYLLSAVYVLPTVLARHLKLPEAELRAGLERLAENGKIVPLNLEGQKGVCYAWQDEI
jgi:hypothetical protein